MERVGELTSDIIFEQFVNCILAVLVSAHPLTRLMIVPKFFHLLKFFVLQREQTLILDLFQHPIDVLVREKVEALLCRVFKFVKSIIAESSLHQVGIREAAVVLRIFSQLDQCLANTIIVISVKLIFEVLDELRLISISRFHSLFERVSQSSGVR